MDARISFLTGRGQASEYPLAITPVGMGGKFAPDGSVLRYPGNTFLCHLDSSARAHRAFCDLQDAMKRLPGADHFSFLPAASFHMTVFNGVSGLDLVTEGWPEHLPRGLPLDEVTKRFLADLDGQRGPTALRMRPDRLDHGTSVTLKPHDEATARELIRLRSLLRDVTGMRRLDHDAYVFHVSLAYLVQWFEVDAASTFLAGLDELFAAFFDRIDTIDLGPVEICEFDDMHAFREVARFGSDGVAFIAGEASDRNGRAARHGGDART